MTDTELFAVVVDHMNRHGFALEDIQSLVVNRHGIGAYCAGCQRWAELFLSPVGAHNCGRHRAVGCQALCRECGAPGKIRLEPPVRAPLTRVK